MRILIVFILVLLLIAVWDNAQNYEADRDWCADYGGRMLDGTCVFPPNRIVGDQ